MKQVKLDKKKFYVELPNTEDAKESKIGKTDQHRGVDEAVHLEGGQPQCLREVEVCRLHPNYVDV